MVAKYVLQVNGVDLTDLVERNSYSTSLTNVTSARITTLDGVDHVTLIRQKGVLRCRLNPQTAAETKLVMDALRVLPAEVYYHCIQRNANVYANMMVDGMSGDYLAKIGDWIQTGTLTFTEL